VKAFLTPVVGPSILVPPTGDTLAVAGRGRHVGAGVGVAGGAMGLRAHAQASCLAGIATSHILPTRNRLQMLPVNTKWVLAAVIQFVACRDWTPGELVDDAMGGVKLAGDADLAVAPCGGSGPLPTSGRQIAAELVQNSVGYQSAPQSVGAMHAKRSYS
jgi:hypothetical protein